VSNLKTAMWEEGGVLLGLYVLIHRDLRCTCHSAPAGEPNFMNQRFVIETSPTRNGALIDEVSSGGEIKRNSPFGLGYNGLNGSNGGGVP
jgi:hypothetical protein